MRSPLPGNLLGFRRNRTLHGRSVHRKADVPGHNVVKGYSTPGLGDGVDLFCPAGTPVYAMHDGYISRIADPGGRLSCIYLCGEAIPGVVESVYAHISLKPWIRIKNYLTPRQWVKQGQCIGYVGRKLKDPHLHLEVWVMGRALSAPTAKKLAEAINGLLDT